MSNQKPESLQEFYEALADTLPRELGEVFREGMVETLQTGRAVREIQERFARQVEDLRSQSVPSTDLEAWLRSYPRVERFLGAYYRSLAVGGELTADLLPEDWAVTESALDAVTSRVDGFDEHWDQHHDRSVSALYAALAEIEGFRGLIQRYQSVEALPHARRGRTPDAQVRDEVGRQLFEVKSLWAYARVNDLREWPPGVYPFGKTGRLRKEERGRLDMVYGQHNSRVVRHALRRLLDDALDQLMSYAERTGMPDCPKAILLVVTQRQPILDTVSTPAEYACEWLARHRTRVSDVIWVAGDSWNPLSLRL